MALAIAADPRPRRFFLVVGESGQIRDPDAVVFPRHSAWSPSAGHPNVAPLLEVCEVGVIHQRLKWTRSEKAQEGCSLQLPPAPRTEEACHHRLRNKQLG